MNRSQAPDALGLLALQGLLLPLFLAGKCARFLHSQLVGAAMRLLEKESSKGVKVNKTKFTDFDWCRVVVGQVLVMISHVRALHRRSYRYKQCIKKLNSEEIKDLNKFLDKVGKILPPAELLGEDSPGESWGAAPSAESFFLGVHGEPAAEEGELLEEKPAKQTDVAKRKVEDFQPSQGSVDSDGIPLCFLDDDDDEHSTAKHVEQPCKRREQDFRAQALEVGNKP
eukprot:9092068-Lingulodinium_polyedra.AAC.1